MSKMPDRKTAKPELEGPDLPALLADLVAAADLARLRYDQDHAIALYTQALAQLPTRGRSKLAAIECKILSGRAAAYEHTGDRAQQLADLRSLERVARSAGDIVNLVHALSEQAVVLPDMGDMPAAQRAGESALELATSSGDRALVAVALTQLARMWIGAEGFDRAKDHALRALTLCRELGDRAHEIDCLRTLATVEQFAGSGLGLPYSEESLRLSRAIGDRDREAAALNMLGIQASDVAQRRDYSEQALEAFRAVNRLSGVAMLDNNLGLIYWGLGLYGKSRAHLERAVAHARTKRTPVVLATFLESLGRPLCDAGDAAQAEAVYQEGLELGRLARSRQIEGCNLLGLGRLALQQGRPADAKAHFIAAVSVVAEVSDLPSRATAASWLGATCLALGELSEADRWTAEAVRQLEQLPGAVMEYPRQEISWWRYQVLSQLASRSQASEGAAEEAWACLQRAREAMLSTIATLSDEGLRRNYLNKVLINRQITLEFARQAAARNLTVEQAAPRSGNLQDQLRRMMEISVRMNEQRDSQALLDFVIDEAVELNGAERSFLVLADAQQGLDFSISRGVNAEETAAAQELARAMWERVLETRRTTLFSDPDDDRSILAAPLVARGQVIGMLYADIRRLFGAFGPADQELLSLFANQAATAIDNARLYHSLERRVAQRTAELSTSNATLEQRNAELSIISGVQQGLAKEMDLQAIVDVVGDELRAALGSQNCMIALYDKATNLLSFPYWTGDSGERIVEAPVALGVGLTSIVISSRQPLVLGTAEEGTALGAVIVEDGTPDMPESWLGVPMLAGNEVIGAVVLQDWPKNCYSEDDVRLVSTLASSLGVALQNARLFAETNQRAAELEIINSVQQGLASKLDVQDIYELVGDKIRDIFDAQSVGITTYDWASGMTQPRYSIEKGRRVHEEPMLMRPGSMPDHLRRTRQPVLFNEKAMERGQELGLKVHPGTEPPLSVLFVPLIVGDQVLGAVDLQHMDRENAFSESDVRLLTTLASSISVALENARLFDETKRLLKETDQRAAELEIINSVQQGLASKLDVQAIYDLVGDKIRDIFDAQAVLITGCDWNAMTSHSHYLIEKGKRYLEEPRQLRPTGIEAHLHRTRQPLVVNENAAHRLAAFGLQVVPGTEEPKSGVFVPMIVGDQLRGMISLQNVDHENAFGESDVRLLSTLASSMSVALENARLFDEATHLLAETQRRAEELQKINEVGQMLVGELDLQRIYDATGDKLHEVFDAQVVAIITYDREPDLVTYRYLLEKGVKDCPGPRPARGFTRHILDTREPLLINRDLDGVAEQYGSTVIFGEAPKSYLGVPLLMGGEARGVITLQNIDHEDAFTDDDVRLLTTLSLTLSVAIENARLFAETRRRADEMAALTAIGREISETLDLPTVLERIATRAYQVLNARDVALRLLQPDDALHTVIAHGKYSDIYREDIVHPGHGITYSVFQTGAPELLNEPLKDPRVARVEGTEHDEENEAILFAPLVAGDQVLGVLTVWRDKPSQGPFAQSDLDFAVGLARQAAIAITNARLFEESHRSQVAADESSRQLADIIDFLPDATLVIDRDSKVIAWNRAMERMTGIKAKDILGKGDYEYAVPFYGERRPILIDLVRLPLEEIEAKYATLQRDGATLFGEAFTPAVQGTGRHMLATASVLRDARGEVVGAIESIRDITDRKQAEEELQQAKLAADSANAAKSAFLATMSHEIRTPMNAIIGMSGLLMDTPLNPEQQDYAETIRASGDALLTIINDILDFSKIEAGKMELENQPFDLRACVEGALDLVAARAAEKRLELVSIIDEQLPSAVVGDMARLRQILVNLLSNAVKFTAEGEVVLSVSGTTLVPAGAAPDQAPLELRFSVRDSGIGIPADRMDRLFQSFSQVDPTTARRFGGTGLGLAISKRLCELMGGRIWAESEPGAGSTFHFTVATRPAPDFATRSRPTGTQPQLSGRRLLVVDDNETNRLIVTRQVLAWGMSARDASSAEEALEWIRRGDPFDLAIIDMSMPDIDGLMLAREIRALRPPQSLKIIIYSSLGQREAVTEDLGIAAFLTKPLKQSQLFDALAALFAAPETVDAPAATAPAIDRELASRMPLRILLAEDNAVNQKLALRILAQMGYRADVAGNGVEAIEALERQPYDVILMDVQMPEMDGLEATRQICRRWPRPGRPRIIAMTANAMQGDREMCLAAGMDDYLSKPIRVHELVQALSSCAMTAPQGETVSNANIVDPQVFDELLSTTGGDAEFMRELIDTYFADAPQLLAQMRSALAGSQHEEFRRAAHSLKSNSATLGALTLSSVAKDLEMMGKDGNLDGAAVKLAQAEAEYACVKAALDEKRSSL